MNSVGLIPRSRLRQIPARERLRHEYCFFLHDECVRALVEYEKAKANLVEVKFPSELTSDNFKKIAATDPIEALRATGYPDEARKVIVNQITMAMVSDCMHHLYESLRCFEKRKFVVAFNLLRKPLKDNLLYLSWMLGDPDGFYTEFTSGNPERLSQKMLGNVRKEIFARAIAKTQIRALMNPDLLVELLYDRQSPAGFEELFQHAVHLVTIERVELRTAPENFNFIFKSPHEDDLYHWLYGRLPYVLLFLTHVIMGLFDNMRKMDRAARDGIYVRSALGYQLVAEVDVASVLNDLQPLADHVGCENCGAKLRITPHNAAKIVLTQSYRCASCKTKNGLPFAWLFEK
jgi:hypothetical protein